MSTESGLLYRKQQGEWLRLIEEKLKEANTDCGRGTTLEKSEYEDVFKFLQFLAGSPSSVDGLALFYDVVVALVECAQGRQNYKLAFTGS